MSGRKKYFWLIALLVILGAALGGGIGGSGITKTESSEPSAVSSRTPSSTSLPPLISTNQDTAYSGGSVASVSWGTDRDFELHVFYQDDAFYIRESIFKDGSWSQNATAIVQAGSSTPIAAMFRPYFGGPNTSVGYSVLKPVVYLSILSLLTSKFCFFKITVCYLNAQQVIRGHVYNDQNNGVWMPNSLGSTEDQTFVADYASHLTGTLLRQPQINGTSIWEPYVLFYQMPNYTIGEIVLWADDDAPRSSASWRSGVHLPHTAVPNSPLTVTAAEYGFGLQMFFLAYAPINLSTNPAVFNYPWWANSSTVDKLREDNASSGKCLASNV